MVLSILAYFEHDDDRLDTVADHLLEQQMPDGAWNCQRPYGQPTLPSVRLSACSRACGSTNYTVDAKCG